MPNSGVTSEEEGSPLNADNNGLLWMGSWWHTGILLKFDQQQFITEEDWPNSKMGKWGFLYYPKACLDPKLEET